MDLRVLLEAFPLWLSSFRDLHRLLPLERELFDLVIVDEATQCDMASALPALFRARRAAVTGDPQQLRHVSFLSRSRQRLLADEVALSESEQEELDYRTKSLLDLVGDGLASQARVSFLDEHFRSLPSIIAFSNREFYAGRLRVMTARPETERRRAVELRRVDGRRAASGVNEKEAEALLEEIARWTSREASLSPQECHSLGVLSPFRDQADHLAQRLAVRLGPEAIAKHDVLVGTAYGFQGEERDVMFLSFAVDPDSHPQAFRHLERADVFNVAITRARSHQYLFVSVAASDCPRGALLERYLTDVATGTEAAPRPGIAEKASFDELLEQVSEGLAARGFRVYPEFGVAGMTVDLVVERDGRASAIDLIGHPGPFAPAIELERYRMFRRAGLAVFPLPWSSWLSDAVGCVDAIERHHGGDSPSDPAFR